MQSKDITDTGKVANDTMASHDAAAARERNGSTPDKGGTGSGSVPGTSGSGAPPDHGKGNSNTLVVPRD